MQYSYAPTQVLQYLNSIIGSSPSVMPHTAHLCIVPFFSGALNDLLNEPLL
jgi:hypothetical protein